LFCPPPTSPLFPYTTLFRSHVIEHRPLLVGERGPSVILLQRFDQRVIQRYPTQKLCVGGDSVSAPVGHGNHRGDHFVLASLQGEDRKSTRLNSSHEWISYAV